MTSPVESNNFLGFQTLLSPVSLFLTWTLLPRLYMDFPAHYLLNACVLRSSILPSLFSVHISSVGDLMYSDGFSCHLYKFQVDSTAT